MEEQSGGGPLMSGHGARQWMYSMVKDTARTWGSDMLPEDILRVVPIFKECIWLLLGDYIGLVDSPLPIGQRLG